MEAAGYESKSVGKWAFVLAGVVGLGGLVVAVVHGVEGRSDAFFGLLLIAFAYFLATFGTLTVRVTNQEIAWFFGRGWLGRRVKLSRVRGTEVRRSPWYWGWGIRWTPHGWLWRTYGLDVVWLELERSKHVGIGTQDPVGLSRAIRDRLSAS